MSTADTKRRSSFTSAELGDRHSPCRAPWQRLHSAIGDGAKDKLRTNATYSRVQGTCKAPPASQQAARAGNANLEQLARGSDGAWRGGVGGSMLEIVGRHGLSLRQ